MALWLWLNPQSFCKWCNNAGEREHWGGETKEVGRASKETPAKGTQSFLGRGVTSRTRGPSRGALYLPIGGVPRAPSALGEGKEDGGW